jgi:hypothetical protein
MSRARVARAFPPVWVLAATLLAGGCGYVGDPLPPLANVPARVTDLAAVQRDGRIVAQFTVPQLTTEKRPIRGPLKFDLRIGAVSPPFNADAWAAQAREIGPVAVENGIARCEIPSAQWTGREIALAVRVSGGNGKESSWSDHSFLTVVPPPETPANLRAEATAEGVRLTWTARGGRFRVFRRPADSGPYVPVATVAKPEWIDAAVEYGTAYSYLVQTIVEIGNNKEAESDPSAAVAVTPVDKFPPAAPTGLRAAAAPSSVELAWERNTEPDLAGYRIYRAEPGGDWRKLADASQVPRYPDRDIAPGRAYRYAVTAVDQAGNESGRSETVEVVVP